MEIFLLHAGLSFFRRARRDVDFEVGEPALEIFHSVLDCDLQPVADDDAAGIARQSDGVESVATDKFALDASKWRSDEVADNFVIWLVEKCERCLGDGGFGGPETETGLPNAHRVIRMV